jgi:hypothetical protein
MPADDPIVQRLKAEGQLTRNSGTNSIKSVKERLEKFQAVFDSMNVQLIEQTKILQETLKIQVETLDREKRREELSRVEPTIISPGGARDSRRTTPTDSADASGGSLLGSIGGFLSSVIGGISGAASLALFKGLGAKLIGGGLLLLLAKPLGDWIGKFTELALQELGMSPDLASEFGDAIGGAVEWGLIGAALGKILGGKFRTWFAIGAVAGGVNWGYKKIEELIGFKEGEIGEAFAEALGIDTAWVDAIGTALAVGVSALMLRFVPRAIAGAFAIATAAAAAKGTPAAGPAAARQPAAVQTTPTRRGWGQRIRDAALGVMVTQAATSQGGGGGEVQPPALPGTEADTLAEIPAMDLSKTVDDILTGIMIGSLRGAPGGAVGAVTAILANLADHASNVNEVMLHNRIVGLRVIYDKIFLGKQVLTSEDNTELQLIKDEVIRAGQVASGAPGGLLAEQRNQLLDLILAIKVQSDINAEGRGSNPIEALQNALRVAHLESGGDMDEMSKIFQQIQTERVRSFLEDIPSDQRTSLPGNLLGLTLRGIGGFDDYVFSYMKKLEDIRNIIENPAIEKEMLLRGAKQNLENLLNQREGVDIFGYSTLLEGRIEDTIRQIEQLENELELLRGSGNTSTTPGGAGLDTLGFASPRLLDATSFIAENARAAANIVFNNMPVTNITGGTTVATGGTTNNNSSTSTAVVMAGGSGGGHSSLPGGIAAA